MKKIQLILIIALSLTALSACQNTVQGFGKDMQNTGQEIQKSVHS